MNGLPQGEPGSFKSFTRFGSLSRSSAQSKGLFNFRFEVGCCANQNPENGIGHSLPLYHTMNERIADKVDFAIMNGDWLYEEVRDTPVNTWMAMSKLAADKIPRTVAAMPNIVGFGITIGFTYRVVYH